jgi:hypothetical protein
MMLSDHKKIMGQLFRTVSLFKEEKSSLAISSLDIDVKFVIGPGQFYFFTKNYM